SIANLGNYVDTQQYVGYFDAAKCYTYQFNAGTPASSYFKTTNIGAGANGHDCSGTAGQWSGNFMNWATMQTIDPFRWALTGGYRAVDTTTQTILEKAWAPASQGAISNFPYRGTDQGTTSNHYIAASLIPQVTPFSTWTAFDSGI